jgi:RNA polymerase sigma-70 factor, ECF subfamily
VLKKEEMPETEIAQELFMFGNAGTAAAAEAKARPEVRLIERIEAGDREAFNDLYKMFAPMVHGIVLAKVPYGEVQDIVQDVFLLAYKNLKTLRDKNTFGGWLATIARNRAAEFHRGKRECEELSEELGGARGVSAEALEVLEVVRSMPAAYRETLVLRLVEGMTGIEIAERTGLTHESVRVNLHRGMELLKKRLGIGK